MKIYAKKKKAYQKKVLDPLAGGPDRISKLAEIEENAVEFALDVLLDLDLPSAPEVTLDRVYGFEDVNVDFSKTVGIANINASFNTLSNHKIRMELPIPITRGNFQRPSIVRVNGKKFIFAQVFIDRLLASFETVRPKVYGNPNPSRRLMHEDNVEKGLFSAPEPDEKYMESTWG